MDFSKGLASLNQKLNKVLLNNAQILAHTFDDIQIKLSRYVSDTAGAYKSLADFSEQKDIPQRGNEPEGFLYGYEKIPSIKPQEKIFFPLIHPFLKVGASAIEENGSCASFFFNFVLRSIISYPIGDSNVYMLDSNVSGDFNVLSPICTELGDMDSEKNMFHYITNNQGIDDVLKELGDIMDRNIRNHISKYPDLYSYNKQNPQMHEPYHFLFIKNIEETLSDKKQIDKLARLIHSQNATKAGIYIYYTFDKNKLANQEKSYFSEVYQAVQNLLNISTVIESPQRHYPDAELSLEPKATLEIVHKVINYVETSKPPVTIMAFNDNIQQMLRTDSLWIPPFKKQKNHLYFPVGYINAVNKKEIDVAFSGMSPHLYVGGKTGSGKSILLHNFILNGALRYSPEQLQFYLVDMKGGVSFVGYKQLPHIAALCASSSRHYAESLLELFCHEIEKRTLMFKREGVTSLDDYNEHMKKNSKNGLPYVFGIIDEFQELFSKTDAIANKSKQYIENIHRLGRAVGVFLASCTQKPPSEIDRSQVGIKMSLICNKESSTQLIGNEGASKLKGVGRAVVNTSESGEEKYNQEFQVAFIHEKKELPNYVEKIREIYLKQNNGIDKYDHLIYDDNDLSAKLSDNPILMHPENVSQSLTPYIYIGIPGFYRKEHVKFCFHRDSQSNVAICGSDRSTALRLVGIITIQFLRFYKQHGAKVYISDLQKQTEPTYNKLAFLSKNPDVLHTVTANLKDTIGEVYQMYSNRKQNPANSVHESEILYSILDLKPDTNFSSGGGSMFSFSGTTEVTPMNMLKELIEDGPDYGIHIMVYSYNYANMEMLQNLSLLNRMEIKIALRGGNSSKLLVNYGSQDIIDQYGKGFIRMPEEMGLKYVDSDGFGDPFFAYDTVGDNHLENSIWNTLFTNLPNKQY